MENRRRYKEGKEFYYDMSFETEYRFSHTLNHPIDELIPMGGLAELLFAKKDTLEKREKDLAEFLKSWEFQKQISFNKGQSTDEDNKTRENRLQREALVDIIKCELNHIEEAIKEEDERKKVIVLRKPFPRGLEGSSAIAGGTGLGHVDFQNVEPLNRVTCIVDERSPYNGMAVSDYIKSVAKPWKIATEINTRKRIAELLKQGKREDQIPRRFSVPLPEWPKGIANHLKA